MEPPPDYHHLDGSDFAIGASDSLSGASEIGVGDNHSSTSSHNSRSHHLDGSGDLSMASKEKDKDDAKQKRKRKPPLVPWKKPKDMPKRPLSAYNIFFKEQREALMKTLKEAEAAAEATTNDDPKSSALSPTRSKRKSNKSVGIGFANLARNIAANWKDLDDATRAPYESIAAKEKSRYKAEMLVWRAKQKEEKKRASSSSTDPSSYAYPSTLDSSGETSLEESAASLGSLQQNYFGGGRQQQGLMGAAAAPMDVDNTMNLTEQQQQQQQQFFINRAAAFGQQQGLHSGSMPMDHVGPGMMAMSQMSNYYASLNNSAGTGTYGAPERMTSHPFQDLRQQYGMRSMQSNEPLHASLSRLDYLQSAMHQQTTQAHNHQASIMMPPPNHTPSSFEGRMSSMDQNMLMAAAARNNNSSDSALFAPPLSMGSNSFGRVGGQQYRGSSPSADTGDDVDVTTTALSSSSSNNPERMSLVEQERRLMMRQQQLLRQQYLLQQRQLQNQQLILQQQQQQHQRELLGTPRHQNARGAARRQTWSGGTRQDYATSSDTLPTSSVMGHRNSMMGPIMGGAGSSMINHHPSVMQTVAEAQAQRGGGGLPDSWFEPEDQPSPKDDESRAMTQQHQQHQQQMMMMMRQGKGFPEDWFHVHDQPQDSSSSRNTTPRISSASGAPPTTKLSPMSANSVLNRQGEIVGKLSGTPLVGTNEWAALTRGKDAGTGGDEVDLEDDSKPAATSITTKAKELSPESEEADPPSPDSLGNPASASVSKPELFDQDTMDFLERLRNSGQNHPERGQAGGGGGGGGESNPAEK